MPLSGGAVEDAPDVLGLRRAPVQIGQRPPKRLFGLIRMRCGHPEYEADYEARGIVAPWPTIRLQMACFGIRRPKLPDESMPPDYRGLQLFWAVKRVCCPTDRVWWTPSRPAAERCPTRRPSCP